MHQYLVGQGYWSYIKGVYEDHPVETDPEYVTWEQAASRIMYCLATLRKTRPPQRRVPKEDARIGFHKTTTHELRAQFRLQRL